MVKFSENEASKTEILEHLIICDSLFIPRLSSRVSLEAYATKLNELATNYEAWENKKLIGLIAIYLSKENKKEIYISNVSIDPAYKRKGIATKLFNLLLKNVSIDDFCILKLEVGKLNISAITFYKKLGFIEESTNDSIINMNLNLKSE
ncbi:GNAT family N-acetyltransferase [Bizionia paragorgiae]|uniref:GNAT family N-acetyltransferase n=1 Tax=Bizionia paragorgiae TaxID=283786 RepID=UPI003A92EEBF